MSFVMNYCLPVLSNKLVNYPKILSETEKYVDKDEQEKVNLLANCDKEK